MDLARYERLREDGESLEDIRNSRIALDYRGRTHRVRAPSAAATIASTRCGQFGAWALKGCVERARIAVHTYQFKASGDEPYPSSSPPSTVVTPSRSAFLPRTTSAA